VVVEEEEERQGGRISGVSRMEHSRVRDDDVGGDVLDAP